MILIKIIFNLIPLMDLCEFLKYWPLSFLPIAFIFIMGGGSISKAKQYGYVGLKPRIRVPSFTKIG